MRKKNLKIGKEINKVLNRISKNMSTDNCADDAELYSLILELKDEALRDGSEESAKEAVRIMGEILGQLSKDKNLLRFFYETHSFDEFSRQFISLNIPNEDRIMLAEQLEYFIKNSSREDIDMVLSVACSVNKLCKGINKRQLKIKFYDALANLNSATIYFVVISGVTEKSDEKIIERLYELCAEGDTRNDESAVMRNPVYALIKLYQFGYIRKIERFKNLLKENLLFKMVCDTEYFEGEDFKAEWWGLLVEPELQEKLAQDLLRGRKIIRKLQEYGEKYAIKSHSYWDIIAAIDTFSMQTIR